MFKSVRNLPASKYSQTAILFLIAVLILTPGFYKNTWNSTGKKFFLEWRKYSDYMVIGRLAESQQHGVFSHGAMIGIVDGAWPLQPGTIENQLDFYLNHHTSETFWTYKSVIGAQGIIFGLFDQITNLPENLNLKIFSGVTGLLTALILALCIIWLQIEFGLLPALLTLIFMVISEWLTLYGGDIYWQLWAFYLPTVTLGFSMARQHPATPIKMTRSLFLIISGTVLIKCLFNGFEFITTTLVMIFTPLIYYAVLHKWNLRDTILSMFTVGVSALAGVFAGLAILVVQISASLAGFQKAIDYLSFTFIKRTLGDPNQYLESAGQAKTSIVTVIQKYLDGRAINLSYILKQNFSLPVEIQDISYLQIFSLFGFFFLLFIILYIWKRKAIHQNTIALFVTTAFSLFSPLSWFVIFKAHSYIHTNLNFIIWQMPFTLLGVGFCGTVIQQSFFLLKEKTHLSAKK